jgi:hypothetical protein
VVGHLDCFHNLAIVNSAAINMGAQVPLESPESLSFGYIPPAPFFIHSSVVGHLDWFYTLAIVNSDAISMGVQVSLLYLLLTLLQLYAQEYYTRGRR